MLNACFFFNWKSIAETRVPQAGAKKDVSVFFIFRFLMKFPASIF